MLRRCQVLVDKLAPNAIGVPGAFHVVLCCFPRHFTAQNAAQEHKGRDAHVCRAMNENTLALHCIHDSGKAREILRLRRLKVHRNMDVSHSSAGHEVSFILHRPIGCRHGQVDHYIETGLANDAKIFGARHAAGCQSVIQLKKVADPDQVIHISRKAERRSASTLPSAHCTACATHVAHVLNDR